MSLSLIEKSGDYRKAPTNMNQFTSHNQKLFTQQTGIKNTFDGSQQLSKNIFFEAYEIIHFLHCTPLI